MQGNSPLVSIIVVTYNNENDIVDCLGSILDQDLQDFEVIVVDNSSSDRTAGKIIDTFGKNEKVKLVQSRENTGYAGGNNIGFQHSKGELAVLLNPDLIVDKAWLANLVQAYYKCKEDAGIICSNVLLFDKRDTINACGNIVHLAGFVFSRFYMEKESKCHECDESNAGSAKRDGVTAIQVAAPSGASMLFSRSSLQKIGRTEPFDTSRFRMEYSDIDLAIDFLSHGLLCYVAPNSRIFHKFRFKMNPQRLATLEKGRYQILGHLTQGTLFSMLPALLLGEIIVWSFIIFGRNKNKGAMTRSKLGTYSWLASNTISRPNNSKTKDMKIMKVMSSDLVIYGELSSSVGKSNVQAAHSFSNRIFHWIRARMMPKS
jgi:GT2 family glycosyltransferase